jgi:hypothetical protein
MSKDAEKTYFMVGLLEKEEAGVVTRGFTVYEFTAGRVYFELVDESFLPTYQQPILVRDAEKNLVKDSPEEALKHLRSFLPKLNDGSVKDADAIKASVEAEIKRISEKYNIS